MIVSEQTDKCKRMDGINMTKAEHIYYLMNGEFDLEAYPLLAIDGVENEFEEGRGCAVHYKKAYDARCRVEEKIGENIEELEEIFNSLLNLAKYQALKMYEFGKKHI